MKRHLPKIIAAALTFFIGVCSADKFPYQIGRIEAYVDVLRGQHKLKVVGLANGEFRKIAATDHGIEVVGLGCIASDELLERTNGYNDVSLAAIERKYGEGVIDSILDRAQHQYELNRSPR